MPLYQYTCTYLEIAVDLFAHTLLSKALASCNGPTIPIADTCCIKGLTLI